MNEQTAAALRKPFPADKIGKLPKGGVTLDYVGHAEVTDRLLEVDPGWTWAPMGYGPDGRPALDDHGGLWILLTVAGVTRPGYGEASGGFSPGDKVKSAIGDAIRNAAMRFGVALDLWTKDDHGDAPAAQHATNERKPYTQSTAGGNTGQAASDGQRRMVYAKLKGSGMAQGTWPEFLSVTTGRDIAGIDELHKGDIDPVVKAIEGYAAVDDMWAGE